MQKLIIDNPGMSVSQATQYILTAHGRIRKIIKQAAAGNHEARQIIAYSKLAIVEGGPYEGCFLGAFRTWLLANGPVIRAAAEQEDAVAQEEAAAQRARRKGVRDAHNTCAA